MAIPAIKINSTISRESKKKKLSIDLYKERFAKNEKWCKEKKETSLQLLQQQLANNRCRKLKKKKQRDDGQ